MKKNRLALLIVAITILFTSSCNFNYDFPLKFLTQSDTETETVTEITTEKETEDTTEEVTEKVTEEITEEVTEAPAIEVIAEDKQVEYADYQIAYVEFIDNCCSGSDYSPIEDYPAFELVYINGDDILELAITNGSYHAASVSLYTYYNGGVKHLGQFGSSGMIQYAKKANLFTTMYEGRGNFYQSYYQINDGKAVLFHSIESHEVYTSDGNISIEYFYDDKAIGEEEFNQLFNSNDYQTDSSCCGKYFLSTHVAKAVIMDGADKSVIEQNELERYSKFLNEDSNRCFLDSEFNAPEEVDIPSKILTAACGTLWFDEIQYGAVITAIQKQSGVTYEEARKTFYNSKNCYAAVSTDSIVSMVRDRLGLEFTPDMISDWIYVSKYDVYYYPRAVAVFLNPCVIDSGYIYGDTAVLHVKFLQYDSNDNYLNDKFREEAAVILKNTDAGPQFQYYRSYRDIAGYTEPVEAVNIYE